MTSVKLSRCKSARRRRRRKTLTTIIVTITQLPFNSKVKSNRKQAIEMGNFLGCGVIRGNSTCGLKNGSAMKVESGEGIPRH